MEGLRRRHAPRSWPAACVLLAVAACTPPPPVVIGPQPAPCTDSIAARVARMPAESVTVADREHALWSHEQCRIALDSAARARHAALQPVAAPGAAPSAAGAMTWPPPACKDSIAARVARMPADSVSPADLEHARTAREECEAALASPPPPPTNPASTNKVPAIVAGIALVVIMMFVGVP